MPIYESERIAEGLYAQLAHLKAKQRVMLVEIKRLLLMGLDYEEIINYIDDRLKGVK